MDFNLAMNGKNLGHTSVQHSLVGLECNTV